MQPLSLTNYCIVSSLGAGQAATLSALQDRKSGLHPCRFETVTIPTYIGEVTGVNDFSLEPEFAEYNCRNNRLAAMALAQDGFRDAVAQAKEKYGVHRIGVFLGTSTSGILESELAYRRRDPLTGALPEYVQYDKTQNTYSVAAFVRDYLGLKGPAVVISAACASTTKAFGNASRYIEAGLCDAAIVGGADSLCLTTLYGFHSLFLTSTAPCRPFDVNRDGISIGEGAGFVLVEKDENTEAIRLLGIGESSDAYHMSSPHPEGLGARLAMERALQSASLKPKQINYVKMHGTATPVGDAAEDMAVSDLFGTNMPCSSLKGHTGHTLGASGSIETIMCALSMANDLMPGTLQTEALDPSLKSHHLTSNQSGKIELLISNSFGFGGSNCSLVLGRAA